MKVRKKIRLAKKTWYIMLKQTLLFLAFIFPSITFSMYPPLILHSKRAEIDMAKQFIMAAHRGKLDEVKAFVERGIDVNSRAFNIEASALQMAATGGHVEVVAYLLSKNANPNQQDYDGFTPLVDAARNNNYAVVELLLRKGSSSILLTPTTGKRFHDVLCAQSHAQSKRNIYLVLTTIPEQHTESMRMLVLWMNRLRVHESNGWNVECPEIPYKTSDQRLKQIRKLIISLMIATLVEQRMQYVKNFLARKDDSDKTLEEVARTLWIPRSDMAQIVDLHDPHSYADIKRLIEINIKRALFGPSKLKAVADPKKSEKSGNCAVM